MGPRESPGDWGEGGGAGHRWLLAAGPLPPADGGMGVGAFCVFVNIAAALREGGGGRGLTRGHGVRGQLGGGPGVYSEEFLCLEPGSGWRLWEEALEVDIPGIAALQRGHLGVRCACSGQALCSPWPLRSLCRRKVGPGISQ